MIQADWESVWARVRAGRHTLVIGTVAVPPEPSDLKTLRVDCAESQTGGGALDEVLRSLEQLFGEPLQTDRIARPPGRPRRILGAHAPRPLEAVLTEACNRFADWASGHAALVLESIDTIDAPALETLAQILQRPGWLRLPLILTAPEPLTGPAAGLTGLLGTEPVVELQDKAPAPLEPKSLPADVLRVLRAGTTFGATFRATQVAELLEEPTGTILERLQAAADAGAPLIDRGDGRFSLSRTAVRTLQAQMLPSLLAFWHERAGEQLGRPAPTVAPAPVEPTPPEPSPAGIPKAGPAASAYEDLFETGPTVAEPAAEHPQQTPEALGPEAPPADASAAPDQARAAAHLQASGQTEAAAERYLAAVVEVAARGDARRALSLAEQELKLLDDLPPTSRRSQLRAQLLLEAGRVQWQAALLGPPFTLRAALESLQAARGQLPETAPAELQGELAATTAGVCYDLGDQASLAGCLDELAAAGRRLLSGGDVLVAARLLNEQAALLVRLEQPLRAAELLAKSREIFESRLQQAPADRTAVEELGQTHHLLARLPLHARVRAGREPEAHATALDHALAAEQAYRRLGQRRALAHVWDTMGRLELARGRREVAGQRLKAAFDSQRELGDVTGLARTTAALAELSVAAGRLEEATHLLGDSIALNAEKGSPIGLAFNRRALAVLTESAGASSEPLRASLEALEQRLSQAESVFGRLTLPGAAE